MLDQCILIVDDSATYRQVLNKILSRQGYLVREAIDGYDALSTISEEAPDLILLDVIMPGIDGFEVCKRIKNNQETSEIPILFVTSNVDKKDMLKGFKLGGVDYITKPFQSEEVLARVNTHLKLRAATNVIKDHSNKLSEMLEKRTKELIRTERQAAFGQFVQGIVHNVRNPLSVIMGNIELAEMKIDNLEKIRDDKPANNTQKDDLFISNIHSNLNCIKKGVNRIIDITQSLLKKSLSDQKEEFEIINLNDLIERELSFLEADLWFKHSVVKILDLSKSPLIINAIPSMIAQVFQNLVRNALDAMHKTPSPKLTIQSGMNEKEVWFSINDNGYGISKENMPFIFDPFYTTKPKDNLVKGDEPIGTGIGLHMCLDMVTLHSGEIKVQSNKETGTTFWVQLLKAV